MWRGGACVCARAICHKKGDFRDMLFDKISVGDGRLTTTITMTTIWIVNENTGYAAQDDFASLKNRMLRPNAIRS